MYGGKFNVTNTSGSGTGTGKVVVNSGATIGGTGIIQPGLNTGNGIKLSASSSLVSGGVQSGTTAGTGLTLDNTLNTAPGSVVLDASVGSATLAFSLGANHSSTALKVLGSTAKELKFASGDTFALTDLTSGGLSFSLNTPYVLIQDGSASSLPTDDDIYDGLATTGGTDASGNVLDGYVTTPVNITFNGALVTNGSTWLYLSDGSLEVVPEPGTWALMLGGLSVLLYIQHRRRKSQNS